MQSTDRDVVDVLLEQHDQIRSLFAEVGQAQGEVKRELFQDLVRLLAVHETAEESIVHPVARRALEGGDQVVDQRLEEEDRAKKELAELYDLGVDHPEFNARLQALGDEIIAHATSEENEEFLRLRTTVDSGRLHRMAGAFEAAEAVAPTRPHRIAPESGAGNLLAGAPVAIFDRVRDAVRDWRQRNDDGDSG